MQTNVSIRHGNLSETNREKIIAKTEKLLRIFDRLTAIEITVDLERQETPKVDLRVSAEHKHDFFATQRSDNLMGAVDTVVHKLEQQLRKYKERIQERHRNAAHRGDREPAEPEPEPEID